MKTSSHTTNSALDALASTWISYCIQPSKKAIFESDTPLFEEWGPGIFFFPAQNATNPLAESIIISCGIHGDETAPIEVVARLFARITTGIISVQSPLLIAFGNPKAALEQVRFIDRNLNRLFFEEEVSSSIQHYETQRAQLLINSTKRFFQLTGASDLSTIHLDLHSAIRESHFRNFAIIPSTNRSSSPLKHGQNLRFNKLLEQSNIEAVVYTDLPSRTFSAYTNKRYGARSATLEMGKVSPFGKNDARELSSLESTLETLIDSPQRITENNPRCESSLRLFDVIYELVKNDSSFSFPKADLSNFAAIDVGKIIAQVDEDESLRLAKDIRILFPNSAVEIGQRAGLLIREREQQRKSDSAYDR